MDRVQERSQPDGEGAAVSGESNDVGGRSPPCARVGEQVGDVAHCLGHRRSALEDVVDDADALLELVGFVLLSAPGDDVGVHQRRHFAAEGPHGEDRFSLVVGRPPDGVEGDRFHAARAKRVTFAERPFAQRNCLERR